MEWGWTDGLREVLVVILVDCNPYTVTRESVDESLAVVRGDN